MELPPIVLEMDVHCRRCAELIRDSVGNAFGAERVYASSRMSMVVVHGGEHLDPWTLKCFLKRLGETRLGRHGGGASRRRRAGVTVVSDGGRQQRSHFEGIVHMGPPPPYPYYPYHPPLPSYGPRWF